MANRSRNHSDKSNGSLNGTRCDGGPGDTEYFWSIELNADKRSVTWMASTEDDEDGDEDFLDHTVFLKSAVLGADAVPDEQNVIMFESMGGEGEVTKGAIANLSRGQNNMTILDLTVAGKVGGTFTLADGSGPVYICGNHLIEFPRDDPSPGEDTQTESDLSLDDTEFDENDLTKDGDSEDDDEADEEEDEKVGKKAPKRRAASKAVAKQKKAKMDVDVDDEGDNDEEDEDQSEDEDYDEDESEKFKKAKKAKADVVKKAKGKLKTGQGKAVAKKVVKKVKK